MRVWMPTRYYNYALLMNDLKKKKNILTFYNPFENDGSS